MSKSGRAADRTLNRGSNNMDEKRSSEFRLICHSCFCVVVLLLTCSVGAGAQTPTTSIRVDQVGYLPNSPKIALVAAPSSAAQSFSVRRTSDNSVVLQGKLSAAVD